MRHFTQNSASEASRQAMVQQQIAARGIESQAVLAAMARVPREAFLPEALQEFAYEDSPLPIAERQTISQPYIVALTTEALGLKGGERVLEVGTGSGYAAAVLAEIASEVYSLERHKSLAESASKTLERVGYDNVHVIHTDGTRGWPQGAPYDAIAVAAGGPSVPQALKEQLAIGGRLVIPVGEEVTQQVLLRVTRIGEQEYREEHLSRVRFVPLIGEQGWKDPGEPAPAETATGYRLPSREDDDKTLSTSQLIAREAEAFDSIESVNLSRLLERIGDSRVVLIGEASHGTSEFYRLRARITQALIEHKGFNIVAAEADWPDASRIDHYVRHLDTPPAEWAAFTRFPTWMWRNEEVRDFVEWLRDHNARAPSPDQRVGFYGLDLYSLFTSIDAVLSYLDKVDTEAAKVARERYGCLTPWQSDPATYGREAVSGRYRECEEDVGRMLGDMLKKRLEYSAHDGDQFFDAAQNARLIANAERYYRSMYSGYAASWNLRDTHMFETLEALLDHHGPESKAVVWEHNSHIGDASGTDMRARGQLNIGQLCRERFGSGAYMIGFGTHAGTVAAASDWGEPMEIKRVRPSLSGSWERLCHDTGILSFMLGLRHAKAKELRKRLRGTQLERAIGVIYRPETERASHYFSARLSEQFDEYGWFDESQAVKPLKTHEIEDVPDTYPFGL